MAGRPPGSSRGFISSGAVKHHPYLILREIMNHLHLVDVLLSCTCVLLSASKPVVADIRREAEALVNWKASLDGADESVGPWSLANSTSLCRWTHITCNWARHIRELDLTGTSLNGTLDDFDFSAFPHLRKLVLIQNGLYGTIPVGIGNLTNLVELEISGNLFLRGAIPRSIGQLKHLAVLKMTGLGLNSTLPEEIGNLTSLEELNLGLVTLTGSIPPTIGMLMKLCFLWLGRNNLTGSIPVEIGNMTELQGVHWKLPGTISHLRELRNLDLFANQLGGHIVAELGNSSLVEMFDISNNHFSGLFPSSICAGEALLAVSAGYNGFTGIHQQTFQNCTTLKFVDFTANNIVADLRDFFSDHPGHLETMSVSQNQLYGTLLTNRGELFLCNCTDLSILDLSNNALHGVLTKCFWDLPTLGFMDLSSNSFTGVVPFSRTCEDNLRYLHLANNHFRGTFPLGLKECKNLVTLDLGGNNFSGTIPSWVLDLSKNKLTGPVPGDFTNFTGMAQDQKDIDFIYDDQYMYLEQIQIVWKNVDYVYNMMIAAMAGIDLSCNSLSQAIPDGLTTLLGLRYLNLPGNHLSGVIPKDIGNLVLLESLDLSRNQLSGLIPPSFEALKAMSILNLSSNGLSGRIPTGSQMQTLDDPWIYSNNPGLCGFPLKDCVKSSTPTQNEGKVTKKVHSCMSIFQAKGPE